MSWDNEHVPTVRIQAKDNYSDSLTSMARKLKQSGDFELATLVLQDKARLDNNVPRAVDKIANDEVDGAQKLIRERQYHSKSGYVGHGNMWKSVKKHPSKDKFLIDIWAEAQSKDGYIYNQIWENGGKSINYPAHHAFHDSGIALDVDKYANEALNNSIK